MATGHRGAVIEGVRRVFTAGPVAALREGQLVDRLLRSGDEAAFEAIVQRHGPMVLGVCRRILDDPHDVDDAFQATFLVLIQNARAIRDRGVLSTWLHGVARRVAVRAKVNARRRRSRERAIVEELVVTPSRDDLAETNEIRSLIDAEISRLPERFRAPVVLCDLEGQSHEEAAERLRCPVGTVKSRHSRARDQLRARLARRGLAPSAMLLSSVLASRTLAAVPIALKNQTLAVAKLAAAGGISSAGIISVEVVVLTKGVVQSMRAITAKLCVAFAAVFGLVAAGASIFAYAPVRQDNRSAGRSKKTESASPPKASVASQRESQAKLSLSRDPKTRFFELKNGLKLILRPVASAKQTALLVVYSIGNDYDPVGRSGLSHMVEHIYLTAAAGDAKARSVEEFARLYPDGANGQTGTRYTLFATVFPGKDLDQELRDAAARMSDLRIAADDLERERPRVLVELANMFTRVPELAAMNNARELVRPTPGSGRRGGADRHIYAISLDDVKNHWKQYYKPRNAIISIAGDLDSETARKAVESHFAKLPAGEKLPAPAEPGAPELSASKELTTKAMMDDSKPMAALAFAAPPPDSDLYAAFLVHASRLSAAAGRLAGDTQSFMPPIHFAPLDDPDVITVSAHTKPTESPKQALARLQSFIDQVTEAKLNSRELSAVRNEYAMFFEMSKMPDAMLAQNVYGVAFALSRCLQMGIDPSQIVKAIESVTDQDLRRVATQYLGPKQQGGAFIYIAK
jgi:zinc protease